MAHPAYTREPAPVYRMNQHDLKHIARTARHDKRLQPGARLLMADICDLSERDGYCTAGQQHFAKGFATDTRTIRRWEKRLEEVGYLTVEQSSNDGRRRRLTPKPPQSTGQNCPQSTGQSDAKYRTTRADTGQSAPVDTGQLTTGTKSIYTPRGESGARAHEGREDSGSQRPDHAPTLDQVKARAKLAMVPEDVAEKFFWHYESKEWHTGGAHPQPIRSWEAKLMEWKLNQSSFERAEPGNAAAGTGRAAPPTFDPAERERKIAAAKAAREEVAE